MNILIDRIGKVSGGRHDGELIKVEPIEDTPHFYVFFCAGEIFDINQAWDDWVEDEPALHKYFQFMAEDGAAVDWQSE